MPYPSPRPLTALAVLLTLCLPSLARAATLNVPTAAYPTIQAAVTAAASGDTVLLADGAYSGDGNRDVDFGGKSLTVTSQHGAALTIIDCGGSAAANHRGFTLHSGEAGAVVSGLTIENGYETEVSGVPDSGEGGGVFIKNSNTTLLNCVVTRNSAQYGGGVYDANYNGGAIVLAGCAIQDNRAVAVGGGVANDNNVGGGTITLLNCTITGNTVTQAAGGGVSNINQAGVGTITLSDCTIANNAAQYYGGGVYNDNQGATITLTGCTVNANTDAIGGGGVSSTNQGGTITLAACSLSGNTDCGVYDDQYGDSRSQFRLTGCTLTGNGTSPAGGFRLANDGGTVALTDDILYGDTSQEITDVSGGTPNVSVADCDVQGGQAGPGDIDADPLFVNAATGDLHLQSGSPCFRAGVDALAADHDGAPYGSPPTIGAFEITGQTGQGYVVTNTNDSGAGSLRAAVAYANADPDTTVTFDSTAFPNYATQTIGLTSGEIDVTQGVTIVGPSGGVFVSGGGQSRVFGITGGPASGPVSLYDLEIVAGTAPADGAPFFGGGGGVAVSGATVNVIHGEFASDRAAAGGGLYNAGGDVTLTSCVVVSDTAGDGGGVFNDAGGTLTLDNVFAAGDQAVNDGGAVANHGALTVALRTPPGGLGFGASVGFFGNDAGNDGGAIANDGLLSVTGGGTAGALVGNRARSGGAVSNAAGGAALADQILIGNIATADGGGVSSAGGALTLTGCAVVGNSAHEGGGVSNFGGAVTLTSCTFTSNGIGVGGGGGGLFTLGGTAALTDDILYGDTGSGGVSEIAGPVTASFCDVQGDAGTPAAPDGNANFSADPLFSAGPGFFGLSIQPSAASPVIGRGTPRAPAFRPADLNGLPYFSPPALGALEGPEDAHVLWANPDGRTILWDTNGSGAHRVAANYDPLADPDGVTGYAARSLSTGPNGVSHVLWSTPGGRAALRDVHPDGTHTDTYYGPFSDDGTSATIWQPVAVSTGGDNVTHVLWDNPNGRTILWDVNLFTGAYIVVGSYGGFSDDGTANTVWKAVALATGPDGLSHILWTNADGNTLLWNLDSNDDQPVGSGSPATASQSQTDTSTSSTYPLQSDDGSGNTIWSARALSVGEDNLPRILWNNPDGRTILWNVNPDGSFAIVGNYSPLVDPVGRGGFTAVALATGADNRSHFAWDNPDGETFLWNLLNDGGSGTNDTVSPFFYGVFSDDGTAATDWKAVAVSAAQAVTD